MPKVSVIVPIYGVEKYIERCVRSLMEQTLDDMEFVFVDDCTPDNSMAVLDSVLNYYPDRRNQVIIHRMEQNSGQAAVRKWGIQNATGEYIIHCDSDDFVDKDMYRQMYEKAVEEDLDIVISDFYEGTDGNWEVGKGSASTPTDVILDTLKYYVRPAVWNKLVRSSLANNDFIEYPVYGFAEDVALSFQYQLLAKKIGYIEKSLYYYVSRPTSIMADRAPQTMLEKQRQLAANFDIVINAIKRSGKEAEYQDSVFHKKLHIKNYSLPALPFTDSYSIWKNTYREINTEVLTSKMFTLREKFNFVITYLGLYPIYYKLKNR